MFAVVVYTNYRKENTICVEHVTSSLDDATAVATDIATNLAVELVRDNNGEGIPTIEVPRDMDIYVMAKNAVVEFVPGWTTFCIIEDDVARLCASITSAGHMTLSQVLGIMLSACEEEVLYAHSQLALHGVGINLDAILDTDNPLDMELMYTAIMCLYVHNICGFIKLKRFAKYMTHEYSTDVVVVTKVGDKR